MLSKLQSNCSLGHDLMPEFSSCPTLKLSTNMIGKIALAAYNALQGTVHLQMPRLGPICKQLGVDYAPAMTGFDIRGGRSVPTIEGVVVCKEDEASVLETYLREEE